jgi:hypothetical protein
VMASGTTVSTTEASVVVASGTVVAAGGRGLGRR